VKLKRIALTVPVEGSEEPQLMPLAAGPRLTLATLNWLASNVRSKFRPLTSIPGSNARITGMVLCCPGFPDVLPAVRVA
jgi:hypothetical protein